MKITENNVLVVQSGGPSPVINASLKGILDGCVRAGLGTVYGAHHGILGVLREELIDLTHQPASQLDLLMTTPSAGYIGSARYKLREEQTEDFQRIIDVCKTHGIRTLFYNGGNDSMDTANKISILARERGLEDFVAVGVPKTVDNDVGGDLNPDGKTFSIIDHTPGYGSVARFWVDYIHRVNEENKACSWFQVHVLKAMGRKVGFIPAAAELTRHVYPELDIPLQIYMPESGLTLADVPSRVYGQLQKTGRVIVVVSEGFDVGEMDVPTDDFGHAMYTALHDTSAQRVIREINGQKFVVDGVSVYSCGDIPNTDQRGNAHCFSQVDLDEAYGVGCYAVKIATRYRNADIGYMATIIREPTEEYKSVFGKVPLEQVANSERHFPSQWIGEDRVSVTQGFVDYALPLIGKQKVVLPANEFGMPMFAVLDTREELLAGKKVKPFDYVPQAYRLAS